MLGCFPDSYPDELFYSVCARYKQRTRFSDSGIRQELFNYSNTVTGVAVDLPTRLAYFIKKLPCKSNYDLLRLIKYNTLLPLFSPFLPINLLRLTFEKMTEMPSSEVFPFRQLAYRNWQRMDYCLHYCPKCSSFDRECFGEAYWHRVHQVPFVYLCPDHLHALASSNVKIDYSEGKQCHLIKGFYPAEDHIPVNESLEGGDFSEQDFPERDFFIRLAKEVQWLLNSPQHDLNSVGCLRDRYLSKISSKIKVDPAEFSRPSVYFSRSPEIMALCDELKEFYSEDCLRSLGCNFDKKTRRLTENDSWLFRMLDPYWIYRQEPIKHFLFIHFLGESMSSILGQNSFTLLPKEPSFRELF